ncbi:T9SS type A sorting domain-containing protein [Rufibacter sp. DG15C]|uniref:T9SS type A sorting domain-containing protein n=1 Tax=Rufibacter sp. DG15C TaxID=1379909 RepID=UPI0012FA97E7|nr:T9SS type A sorting domain-containing protein [Rufibacter sp. DG15C]
MKKLILPWVITLYILVFNIPLKNQAQGSLLDGYIPVFSEGQTTVPFYAASSYAVSEAAFPQITESEGALLFCTETASAPYQQNGCDDAKPSEISGSLVDPCPGAVVTYSVTANPDFTNYEWEMPRSGTGNIHSDWMIISGQGTNTIRVRAGEKNGTIKLTVTHNKCGKKVQTLAVTPKNGCVGTCPAPTATLVGPSVVCYIYEDDTNPYTYAVENPQEGVTYDFMFPEGFIVVNSGPDFAEVLSFFIPGEVDSVQTVMLLASNGCNSSINTLNVTLRDQNCEPGGVLPVELVSFNGISRNGSVELSWSTATEINNDRFEVERSTNGKDFSTIGEVKGAGNSSMLLSYGYKDKQAPAGNVYYRLNQVDLDGSHEYSKVVSVQHSASTAAQGMQIKLFPNPITDGNLTVKVESLPEGSGNISYSVMDMNGKLLHTATLAANTTEVNLPLRSLGLRQGVYVVSFTSGKESQMQRILIQ